MSWDTFRAIFIDQGLAVNVPVKGRPPISLFTDPGHNRIGLTLPSSDDPLPATNMRAITLERVGARVVLATDQTELHQPFYALMQDISDRVQLDGRRFGPAFEEALGRWRRMLLGATLMPAEVQLGLTGELWLLLRLLSAVGPEALSAWTAVHRDAHDFRIDGNEIEVKTTSAQNRVHLISRLDQLEASPNAVLYLLSLQIVAAGLGAGWTLLDQIGEVRAHLADHPKLTEQFNAALSDLGWAETDSAHYVSRYRLRSRPALVRVDESCPRLVPEDILSLLGPLSVRVGDVRYRVDVDGLGAEDGTPGFNSVIPTRRDDGSSS